MNGSIIDARNDDDPNVYGQIVDLDANGDGADIGEAGNDLEIDSRRGSAPAGLNEDGDDVALEATDNIWLTETEGELRLVFAHTYDGDIRLTVREGTDATSQAQYLDLIDHGSARFAEGSDTIPGTHTDANRIFDHGQVYAETGSVELRVGDDVTLDANSEIVAGKGIIIRGDFGDLDPGYGTTILLRGQIIAGAVLLVAGNRTPSTPASNTDKNKPVGTSAPNASVAPTPAETVAYANRLTQIFGNSDVDSIQFGDPTGATSGLNWGDDGLHLPRLQDACLWQGHGGRRRRRERRRGPLPGLLPAGHH